MNPLRADPELLLAHDDFVRAVARGLLRDEHAVDDVAQQTWLAALQHAPASLASPRAWLASVARNFARRAARGASRRDARERAAALHEGVPSSEEILRREEARRRVVRAVLELDEPYRATLLLRYFESLVPREIAAKEGVSVDTVTSRLQRGLARVRACLERDERGWALALAPFARPEPSAAAIPTVILMATKTKAIAAVAAALLLAAGAWWMTAGDAGEGGRHASSVGAPASPQVAVARVDSEAPREAIAAKTPSADPPKTVAASAPIVDTPSPPSEGWLASPDDPCGSVLVRVVDEDSGAPVESVQVGVLPYGSHDPLVFGMWAPTRGDGVAEFERVAAGEIWIAVDRANVTEDRVVVAGRRLESTLRLPRGMCIEGRVLDAAGKPVEGAEVLLDRWSPNASEPVPVARSSADGAFRIDRVGEARLVGARKRGYSPSDFGLVPKPKGAEPAHADVVLPGAGGAVEGVVRDGRGVPAAGALVLVGSETRTGTQVGEALFTSPASLRVRTDRSGRFHVWGVAPGAVEVQARAHGCGTGHREVEVRAGETTSVELALETEVLVEGVARDADGAPIAGATIELGSFFSFSARATTTGRDGRYRLGGLPSKDLDVRAWVQRWEKSVGHAAELKAHATLRGAPGETVRWDPVLRIDDRR